MNLRLFPAVFLLFSLFFSAILLSTPAHAAPITQTSSIDEVESNDTAESAQLLTEIGAQNPVSASMSTPEDIDWFRFEAVAGKIYAVETFNVAGATHPEGSPMQLVIYDSNFTEIAKDATYYASRTNGAGNTNAGVSFEATNGGAYYIQVYLYNRGGSGPYSLRVLPNYDLPEASWDEDHEPNNWANHAFELQIGATQMITSNIEARNGSYLTSRSDRDWFRFDAVQGKTYVVETLNVAGATSTAGSPMQLFVYDTNFTEVAKDATYYSNRANGYGNTNASVEFEATTGGTYYIKVHPYRTSADNGSGPYSIRVLPHYSQPEANWDQYHEPNNWASNALELQIGRNQSVRSAIEQRSSSYLTVRPDRDWFRFDAVAGQEYVVETFNVAGAIDSSGSPLQLVVYDSDFTEVAKDATYYASRSQGAGNVNASVGFIATKGGTYYILAYPYANSAGSGPYSIRVLPHYRQSVADWDAALEPNNWRIHAAPLELLPCGRLTNIESRNSSFITTHADRDWFRFELDAGQQYAIDLYDVSSRFERWGLVLKLYDREISQLHNDSGMEVQHIFTADYSGVYFAQVYPYSEQDGTYRIRVTPTDGEPCAGRPLPLVQSSGCASVGVNSETGWVTLRGTPRNGCSQEISRVVTCPNNAVPQNVTLNINTQSFEMSVVSGNRFSATIDTGRDLPSNSGPLVMSVSRICGGQSGSQTVGEFVFFDPSGTITDADTDQPIQNATVTLYRVENAVPDKENSLGDCRTVDTRDGDNWNSLPNATSGLGVFIDPVLDSIFNTQQISPTINPQITGSDGSYAWDVVEGCWYVTVEAEGYQTRVSPVVGVPPEVTDLNLSLMPVATPTPVPTLTPVSTPVPQQPGGTNTNKIFLPVVND